MLKQPKTFRSSSFHGTTINMKPSELIKFCEANDIDYGDHNDGEDKSNFDFDFETDEGIYFTVYDWKEYRKISVDENIEFHIGGETPEDTKIGYNELKYGVYNN